VWTPGCLPEVLRKDDTGGGHAALPTAQMSRLSRKDTQGTNNMGVNHNMSV